MEVINEKSLLLKRLFGNISYICPRYDLADKVKKGYSMLKKVLLAIMICCMMVSIVPIRTYAAQPETIQPMWTNTTSLTANIAFLGTTGEFTVIVLGKTGVTNITLDIQLYYKNTNGSWVKTNESWQYDVDQRILSAKDTFDAVRGREYKIEVTGTVTKGGVVEEIDGNTTKVCP